MHNRGHAKHLTGKRRPMARPVRVLLQGPDAHTRMLFGSKARHIMVL
jgi:hypothetical protein